MIERDSTQEQIVQELVQKLWGLLNMDPFEAAMLQLILKSAIEKSMPQKIVDLEHMQIVLENRYAILKKEQSDLIDMIGNPSTEILDTKTIRITKELLCPKTRY